MVKMMKVMKMMKGRQEKKYLRIIRIVRVNIYFTHTYIKTFFILFFLIIYQK
jgi:hypothetical protein